MAPGVGDTLAKLAARYLGSSDRYGEIFAANRPLLSTPDLLPIGARLVIPPRQRPAPPLALDPEDSPPTARLDEQQMPRLELDSPRASRANQPAPREPSFPVPSDDDSALVPVPLKVPVQDE